MNLNDREILDGRTSAMAITPVNSEDRLVQADLRQASGKQALGLG